jgi:hypothetical protein
MMNMDDIFKDLEASLLADYKAITPEQHTQEQIKRKIQREYEAKHTAIETEEERQSYDEDEGEDYV